MNPARCRKLVTACGSQRAAARKIGIPRKTLAHWLEPERDRERFRKWYQDLSGFEYNKLLLRVRRHKAMHRMAERNKRREAMYGALSPQG